MTEDWKKSMRKISEYAGQRKDYVQGGGGNTSVKLDNGLMAIKASGYTLREVTEEKGYVTVDYQNIKRYYNTFGAAQDEGFEKESLKVNLDNIVLLEGMENKRPSVEVGFHSFLKRCVIHTHSVYSNILCCSEEGQDAAQKILADEKFLFIPYTDPGFRLTIAVKQAAESYVLLCGESPDIIFLENHGVIVHSEDAGTAVAIHERLNDKVRAYFKLPIYPEPAIRDAQDGYVSDTNYLKSFIKENDADEEYFCSLALYPDQLVYTGNKMGNTIKIENGVLSYRAGLKEAQTIEETLLGVAYVINEVSKAGLKLKKMERACADFINSWESEKYRSNLIK